MTLTTNSIVDEITVSLNGIILIRTNTTFLDQNNNVMGQNYFRTSLVPGQDISEQPENVVAIANLTWTPEVISAYQASLPSTTTGA